ncbi:MAG: SDR family NAD(P)-dependent oxidoreductase, partial [Mycobacterium sp.]
MAGIEQFRYDGKRALVVGGATGMGAAAAKTVAALGAEVIVMDYAPVASDLGRGIQVDLRDRASVDNAIAEVGGPINAIFSAAGVADGPDLMRINFISHRHLIERMLTDGQLPRGSAICFISSVGGIGWENDLPRLQEFLATPDFESADAWVSA